MKLDAIYLGDCLDIMPTLDAGSIDAIITDLPYGTTACKWDTVIPFESLWKEVKRVLKPNGVFITTASQPFTSALIMSNPEWFKCEWIWNKKKGGNILNLKYQPYKIHENILIFCEKTSTYNPIMIPQKERTGKTYSKGEANGIKNYGDIRTYNKKYPKSIIEISNADQRNKLHPTQKPIELYEYLIKTYTNDGETVLDICMGCGTTILSAQNTNRHYIGIEKDPQYFNIAKCKIEENKR